MSIGSQAVEAGGAARPLTIGQDSRSAARAAELKGTKRKGAGKADDESALLTKIAEMPDADRVLAERVHAVITAEAPRLSPKTCTGMPAYTRNGKVAISPTAFVLTRSTAAEEKEIGALVRKAAGCAAHWPEAPGHSRDRTA